MNIMILVGGFWGKISVMHFVGTVLLAALGAMIGNFIAFWMGKHWGRHIIETYGHYISFTKTDQQLMESQLQKNGFWYIVLGKFHGTLRAFIPFIAGAALLSSKKFWLYNTIGSLLWSIAIVSLGVFFIENYEKILDNFGTITTAILILFVLYMWFFKRESLKKYFHDKNREMEEMLQKKNQ